MSKVLYFTDLNTNFSNINPHSVLVQSVDCDFNQANEFHTTLRDLSVVDVLTIVHHFDKITIAETGFDKSSQLYTETKNLLSYINSDSFNKSSDEKTFIENLSVLDTSTNSTLWVFGCSHSYGTGLDREDQRYGNILADKLNMPLRMIAKPGGSMNYSLRHIINSNFNQNDFVIWQIINPARLSYFDGQQVKEILLANTSSRTLIDFCTDAQMFFNHFTQINIGVRYLRAIGCKFMLVSVDHTDHYNYINEYKNYPEYAFFPNFAVDLANDNLHFGPLSHKNLALSILDHIHYNYG